MAGLINWKKVAIPPSNPDADHLYVGIDVVDCFLYIKDDAGNVTKYVTSANVAASIAAALADYDLSTVVDSKISAAVAALVDASPGALDTLNELAAALGDDANFAGTVTTALAGKQPLDADLTAVAGLSTSGLIARTGAGTATTRSVAAGTGISVANGDGVSGNPTVTNTDTGSAAIATHLAAGDPHPQYLTAAEGSAAYQPLDGDLTAVAALAGAGFAVRTTTNTWATRSLTTPPGSGLAITNQDGVFGSPAFSNTDKGSDAVTTHEAASDPHPQYLTAAEGNAAYQPLDADLTALAGHTGTGILVRTGAGTVATRFIAISTGLGASQVDGVAGNPTIFNSDTGSAAVTAHVAAADPHSQYATDTDLTSGLALKYDASNPSGFETPSQLNTRDTNNRNRANHTGTSLASTISNFAATVIGSVLTGYTVGADAVVAATDTVMGAIAKLQGQLNQRVSDFNAAQAVQDGRLDALEATDAEWNELFTATTLTNTSNATLTNISDLSVATTAGRTYYLEYTLKFRTVATTTGAAFSIGVTGGGSLSAIVNIPIAADGTAALFSGSVTSAGDVVVGTGVQAANTTYIANIKGVFVCTTSGTIFPQFRSEVNGSQVSLIDDSIALVREF